MNYELVMPVVTRMVVLPCYSITTPCQLEHLCDQLRTSLFIHSFAETQKKQEQIKTSIYINWLKSCPSDDRINSKKLKKTEEQKRTA